MDGRGMAGQLRLENIRLKLGGSVLLALDAEVAPGEVLTVMGPSGSGKSSLLAFIAGFLDPAFIAEGRVVLEGLDITHLPAEKRRIGLLFQDPMLFPHFSVAGNLLFGVPRSAKDRQAQAAAALAQAGLEGFGTRDPATLSGGQKARVALMRLLLSQPCAVLLDEPFSKLDAALRDDVRSYVFATIKARGLPCLLVTHDEADAKAAGGRIIRI
jgi:putative thiamine transport system ATP-binding protein